MIDLAHSVRLVFTHGAGERAHLRAKGINSNGRDYLNDLYKASTHVGAKVVISVDDRGKYAQRVGPAVVEALKHDPVYRSIVGMEPVSVTAAAAAARLAALQAGDAGGADVVTSGVVCELAPRSADAAIELVGGELRADLDRVAKLFSLQSVIQSLSGAEPLAVDSIASVSNARFPKGARLKAGHDVEFRGAVATEALPAADDDPIVARVVRIFQAAGCQWVRLTPYRYVDFAADVAVNPLAAPSANWRELELQPTMHVIVPICALQRHVLLEHKHNLPFGAGVAFDPAVHCRFATTNWCADTNPRRVLECLNTNLRYLFNRAVSEKHAVHKYI